MKSKEEAKGYEAQSQNELRSSNPYLVKAMAWDKGWADRERETLRHRLVTDRFVQGTKDFFMDIMT